MIEELAVYRGAGFRKLPLPVFLFAVLVTLPFVLATAAYNSVRQRLRGSSIRAKPGVLYVGRRRYDAPIFEAEAIYGGGGRVVAVADETRIELPTGPLSYTEANELATTLTTESAPIEEDGRYR